MTFSYPYQDWIRRASGLRLLVLLLKGLSSGYFFLLQIPGLILLYFSDDSIKSTVRSALIYSDPEALKAPESHARIQKQAETRPLTS